MSEFSLQSFGNGNNTHQVVRRSDGFVVFESQSKYEAARMKLVFELLIQSKS